MERKSAILSRIRQCIPATPVPMPEMNLEFLSGSTSSDPELYATFLKSAKNQGAEIFPLAEHQAITPWVKKRFQGDLSFFRGSGLSEEMPLFKFDPGSNMKGIDVALIKGHCGVAENGCIWIPEEVLPHRLLPFICEHLVIVLQKQDIVENMHAAYDRIAFTDTGFGVFIAGPSKTADIEQSLVTGAQAARSTTILIRE